jgi:hypothetical protein
MAASSARNRAMWPLWCLLAVAAAAQVGVASLRPPPSVRVDALPAPPPLGVLEVLALGQRDALARLLMLWLQAQDYQPGISVPLRRLDYARVEAWLARILALDPAFGYPLLVAARLYGEVDDPPRQRRMIEFVRRAFAAEPATRWQWQAHAVYLAKHRLHDLPYALALAEELAAAPDPERAIPTWARQLHVFVREDLGELEAVKILLGGLLESGEIDDANERAFLSWRLADLERRLAAGREAQADPSARSPKE